MFESPRSKQRQAQKDLDDFNRQDRLDDLESTKDAEIEILNKRIENWNNYLKALQYRYEEADRIERDRLLAEMMRLDQSMSNADLQKTIYTKISADMENFITVQENNYKNYLGIFTSFLNQYRDLVLELNDLQRQSLTLQNSADFLGKNDFGNINKGRMALIDYSVDYQARINNILNNPSNYDKNGNLLPQAATLIDTFEGYRNQKIEDLGLDYEKTYGQSSGAYRGNTSGGSSSGNSGGGKSNSSNGSGQKTYLTNMANGKDWDGTPANQGQINWAKAELSKLEKEGHANGILGGPVTYTGLSMLHGTPSKPEYVLNSDQAYNLLRNLATTKLPEYTSTLSQDMGVSYIIQGDVVLENCDDPAQFWNQVMAATHNRYNVTKNKR